MRLGAWIPLSKINILLNSYHVSYKLKDHCIEARIDTAKSEIFREQYDELASTHAFLFET
jgi:hypothetical protein